MDDLQCSAVQRARASPSFGPEASGGSPGWDWNIRALTVHVFCRREGPGGDRFGLPLAPNVEATEAGKRDCAALPCSGLARERPLTDDAEGIPPFRFQSEAKKHSE